MEKKYTIILSENECQNLMGELYSLRGYHWNDDRIHADNCGGRVVDTIKEQIGNQNN